MRPSLFKGGGKEPDFYKDCAKKRGLFCLLFENCGKIGEKREKGMRKSGKFPFFLHFYYI